MQIHLHYLQHDRLSVMAEPYLEKDQLDCSDYVSRSAYHANTQVDNVRPVSSIFLCPFSTKQHIAEL